MTVLCQWCGAANPGDREYCLRCSSKLLVLSGVPHDPGESAAEEEETVLEREGLEFDEHLLERLSAEEESAKRLQAGMSRLQDRVAELERSVALLDAGMQALVNLLDRRQVLPEAEVVAAWEHAATSEMIKEELVERLRSRRDVVVARARSSSGPGAEELTARALQSAELSLLAGQPLRAAEALAGALRRGPHNPELAELLGELAFERNDLAVSEHYFRLTVQWDPGNLGARIFLGTILADTGRDGEAKAELERAAAQAPDSFLPHFSLGALHAAAGRREPARKHLRLALEREQVPHALFLLGMVELDAGRPGAAAEALERAIELDPDFEDAIYYLGLAYLERGWKRRALECFRRVLEIDPQRLQYQEAVWLVEGHRNGSPVPPEVEGLLREAPRAVESGKVERAFRSLQRAARLSEHPNVLASLALLAVAAGRQRQALAAVHRLLRMDVRGAPLLAAWTALLELLRATRRYSAVERWAERLTRDGAGDLERAIASYELALAELDRGGDPERARVLAQTALKLMPSELRQYPLAALGRVHLAQEQYSDAVDYLDQAANLSASPAILTQLGLALLGAGDGDRAREVLQRARTGTARDLKSDVLTHLARVGTLAGYGRRRR